MKVRTFDQTGQLIHEYWLDIPINPSLIKDGLTQLVTNYLKVYLMSLRSDKVNPKFDALLLEILRAVNAGRLHIKDNENNTVYISKKN